MSTAPDSAAAQSAAGSEGVAELTEPTRAALVTLAGDVLGRLPAEEVPAPLRAVAKFTPGKRHRLGGTALAAALDGDEDFRAAVGRVVETTSPALAAAVREGTDTAAADPVDVALVLYLLRPQGWRDALAAANGRWRRDRDHQVANRSEVEALRADLARLRSQSRGEPARTREAVAAARAEADTELAEARRTVRDRTRDLRQAERERDAALADIARLRGELEAQASAQDAEARRQRGRLADAERAAEAARRGSRTERDIDDARLWLLVDTLVQAAGGVRRELSLPAPTLRPADTVGSAAAGTAARSAADPAALDRLLALPNVHLVVDGYNVTKTGYGELSLAEQRTRLVGALAAVAGQTGAEITIAFDGGAKPPAQPPTPRGVRVLFSAADEIADDLIRRLVGAEPAGRPVVVVSSDRQVVTDVGRCGAWTVASAVLLARLG